jgi:hypothetical protein
MGLKKLLFWAGTAILGWGSVEIVEVLPSKVIPYNPAVKVAVVIDKKRFFQFLPQLLNSLNSYFISRDGNYQFKVFDISQLPKALAYSPYILYYPTQRGDLEKLLPPSGTPSLSPTPPVGEGEQETPGNPQPQPQPPTPNYLVDENHLFFVPTLSKRGAALQLQNLYYGGLQFWRQILYLHQLEQPAPTAIVTQKGTTPNLLLKYETQLHPEAEVFNYPLIPSYWQLRNKNIYINLGGVRSAQFLSTLSSKLLTSVRQTQVPVKVVLGSQLSYSPRVIDLTQPRDREKLIVANSIQNLPDRLLDTSQLLGGDLRYNWLGYTSAVLLNGIYNFKVGNPIGQLGDFQLTMTDHQVQYQTKLYQIVDRGFAEVVPPSPPPSTFPPPSPPQFEQPQSGSEAGTSVEGGNLVALPSTPPSPGSKNGSNSSIQVIEEETDQFPR